MPCSCKNRNRSVSTTMQSMPKGTVKVGTESLYNPNQKAIEVSAQRSDSSQSTPNGTPQYDFVPTVRPYQLCTNCAHKHISYALALVHTGHLFDFCAAAAQVYAANRHLIQHDANLAKYCRVLAHRMLQDLNAPLRWYSHLHCLLQHLSGLKQQLYISWDSKQDYGIDLRTQTSATRTALLHLLHAHSLLYTQIAYEVINKDIATGVLVRAIAPGRNSMKLRQLKLKVRQIWKVLQQTAPNSSQYYRMRPLLQDIIRQVIHMYRELLPASDTWDDCSDSDCTVTVHPSPAASYVIQDTL